MVAEQIFLIRGKEVEKPFFFFFLIIISQWNNTTDRDDHYEENYGSFWISFV